MAFLFHISQRGKSFCFHFTDKNIRFGKAPLLKVMLPWVAELELNTVPFISPSTVFYGHSVLPLTTYWSLTGSWAPVLYIFMFIISSNPSS